MYIGTQSCIHNFWVKALTLYFLFTALIMIPTNKNISVLHPYVHKMWWAVKMMIYLSNLLQEKNNNIIFYTFSYDKNIFSNEKINFIIKSYYKKNILKIFSFFLIAYKIRKSDYIIIWNSPMHFVWVLSKILFFSKAKLIWWNHHYPWYYSKNTNLLIKVKQLIEKLIVLKIDSIVSNSKYLKNIIDKIWTLDSKILHPIIDDEFLFYKKDNNKKNNLNNIIFTYWRWTKDKNLWIIFKTYDNLKSQITDLTLMIWWEWEDLLNFKNKYKNDKNVFFLWSLVKKQIITNLIKTKVFLFPSKIDSFWLVKIESLSIWVPVICFDNNFEEIVKNWFNGFLVKSDKDFILKTKEVLNDDLLQKNLSNNSILTTWNFNRQNFEKQLNDIFMF